jgi:signal peptidase II
MIEGTSMKDAPNSVSRAAGLKWCWLSVCVIALDQWTKYLAVDNFVLYESKNIFPSFNLTLLYNHGAAFSLLSEYPNVAVWLFSLITIVVVVAILVWLKNLPPRSSWTACALSLILGGGLGNLIDRISYGHVVDFLDFYYGSAHFPAFNIADSAITVGAVMIFLNMFVYSRMKAGKQ